MKAFDVFKDDFYKEFSRVTSGEETYICTPHYTRSLKMDNFDGRALRFK